MVRTLTGLDENKCLLSIRTFIMKRIILLLLLRCSFGIAFNHNTIVTIYNNDNIPLCTGVIIADKYVISSAKYCYTNEGFINSYIKYLSIHIPHKINIISVKLINNQYLEPSLILFKVDVAFDTNDISPIAPDQILENIFLPKSYIKILCNDEIVTNDEELDKKNKVSFPHLSKVDYFVVGEKIFITKNSSPFYKLKDGYDKSFLWNVCNGVYTLQGIYESYDEYTFLPLFNSDIIIKIAEETKSDLDINRRNFVFVNIPILDDDNVNKYIKRLISEKWIDTSHGKISIPFKSANVTINPCGSKVKLILLYLYKHPEPNIKFVLLTFYCEWQLLCFKILDKEFFDHTLLTYRSSKTNLIMLFDPAISDESFPLDDVFSGKRIMNLKVLKRKDILKKLYYFIHAPNIAYPYYTDSLFFLQQQLPINDDVYQKVISDNQYCFE